MSELLGACGLVAVMCVVVEQSAIIGTNTENGVVVIECAVAIRPALICQRSNLSVELERTGR